MTVDGSTSLSFILVLLVMLLACYVPVRLIINRPVAGSLKGSD